MKRSPKIIVSVLFAPVYYFLNFPLFYFGGVLDFLNWPPDIVRGWIFDFMVGDAPVLEVAAQPITMIFAPLFLNGLVYLVYGFFLSYLLLSLLERILRRRDIRLNRILLKIPFIRFIDKRYRQPRWILFVVLPILYSLISVMVTLFDLFVEAGILAILFGGPIFELQIFLRDVVGFACAPGQSFCLLEMAALCLSLGVVLGFVALVGYALGLWIERFIKQGEKE